MMVACVGEAGFPLGWNVRELVVSIIPALVSMQVFEQQGRWPGAGGVYGGYPVSRAEARRRYKSVRARHEEASYRRAAKGDCSDGGVSWRFSRVSRLLFLVWGRLCCARVAATGRLLSCRAY